MPHVKSPQHAEAGAACENLEAMTLCARQEGVIWTESAHPKQSGSFDGPGGVAASSFVPWDSLQLEKENAELQLPSSGAPLCRILVEWTTTSSSEDLSAAPQTEVVPEDSRSHAL